MDQEMRTDNEATAWPELSADMNLARTTARTITLDTQRASEDGRILEVSAQLDLMRTRLSSLERHVFDAPTSAGAPDDLLDRFASLDGSIASTTSRFEELAGRVAATEEHVAASMLESVDGFDGRLSAVEDARLAQTNELNELTGYLEQAFTRIAELAELIENERGTNATSRAENFNQISDVSAHVDAKIQSVNDAITSLTARVDDATNNIDSSNATVAATVEASIAELQSRVDATEARFSEVDEVSASIQFLTARAEALEETQINNSGQIVEHVDHAHGRIDAAEAQLDELKTTIISATQESPASSDDVDRITTEIETVKDVIDTQANITSTHATSIEDATRSIEDATRSIEDVARSVEAIETDNVAQSSVLEAHSQILDATTGLLSEHSGLLADTQESIAGFDARLAEHDAEVAQVLSSAEMANQAAHDAADRISNIAETADLIGQRVDLVDAGVTDVQARVDANTETIHHSSDQISVLEGSVAELSEQLSNAAPGLEAAHARIDEAEAAAFDAASRIDAHRADADRVEEVSAELHARIDTERSQTNQSIDDTTTELNSRLDSQRTEIDQSIDSSATELHGRIDTQRTEIDQSIGNSATELHARIDTQRTEIDQSIGNSATELHARIDTQRSKIDQSIDETSTELHGRIDHVSTELNTRIDETFMKIDELSQDGVEEQAAVDHSEDFAEFGRRIDETGTNVSEAHARIDTTDTRIDDVHGFVNENSTRIDSVTERIEETHSRIDQTDNKIASLDDKIENATSAIDERVGHFTAVAQPTDLSDLTDQVNEINGRFEGVDSRINERISEATNRVDGLGERVNGVHGRIDETNERVSSLADQVTALEAASDDDVNPNALNAIDTEALSGVRDQVADLRDVVGANGERIEATQLRMNEIDQATSDLLDRVDDLGSINSNVQSLLDASEARANETTESLRQSLFSRIQDAETRIDTQIATAAAVPTNNGNLDELQASIAHAEESAREAHDLSQSLRVLQTDLVQAIQSELRTQAGELEQHSAMLGELQGTDDFASAERVQMLEAKIVEALQTISQLTQLQRRNTTVETQLTDTLTATSQGVEHTQQHVIALRGELESALGRITQLESVIVSLQTNNGDATPTAHVGDQSATDTETAVSDVEDDDTDTGWFTESYARKNAS